MKVGVNVLSVNDWDISYFQDLQDQARLRKEGERVPAIIEDMALWAYRAGLEGSPCSFWVDRDAASHIKHFTLRKEFKERLDQLRGGRVRLMQWGGVFSPRTGDLDSLTANGHQDKRHPGGWHDDVGSPWAAQAQVAKLYDSQVHIPTNATDEDAYAMGESFGRALKGTDRSIAVAYSNELWHGGYPQRQTLPEDFVQAGTEAVRRARSRCYAFEEGFTATGARNEVIKVFEWQLGKDAGGLWPFMLDQWSNDEPVSVEARASLATFDAFAVPCYAGSGDYKEGENLAADLIWLKPALEKFVALSKELGLRPWVYEFGSHWIGPRAIKIQDSPNMARLWALLMNMMKDVGIEEAMAYALAGRWSEQWGCWGMLENWDRPSKKWLALVGWIEANQTGGGGGGPEPEEFFYSLVITNKKTGAAVARFGRPEELSALLQGRN